MARLWTIWKEYQKNEHNSVQFSVQGIEITSQIDWQFHWFLSFYLVVKRLMITKNLVVKTRRNQKELSLEQCMVLVKCIKMKMSWWVPAYQATVISFTNTNIQAGEVFGTYLEPLTTNKYTVNDSFNFETKIDAQDSINFLVSLDIHSLFTSPPPKEILHICTKKINFLIEKLKIFYLQWQKNHSFIFHDTLNKLTEQPWVIN